MPTFDQYGLPRPNGASDWGDSAVIAGLMWVFKFGDYKQIDLTKYVIETAFGSRAVRHPYQAPWNNYKNMTRDNTVPLLAGLRACHLSSREPYSELVFEAIMDIRHSLLINNWWFYNTERDYPGSTKHWYPHTYKDLDGTRKWKLFDCADFATPEVREHVHFCSGMGSGLIAPINRAALFQAKFRPMSEPNQLISMMLCAGSAEPVKIWKYHNLKWRECIHEYWSGWRNEAVFAAYMVHILEQL